jgi:hypothetical protein
MRNGRNGARILHSLAIDAMRSRGTCFLALIVASSACAPSPTERDIVSSLERQLQTAEGDWTGTSSSIALTFALTQDADGQLAGHGTMRETDVAGALPLPIVVSGSYQRPTLVLVFTGMTRRGQSVRGDVSGQYTSVGGVSATLLLTGTDGSTYSEQIPVLLQEVAGNP